MTEKVAGEKPSPYIERDGEGALFRGLSIDRVVSDGEFLLMSGWDIDRAEIVASTPDGLEVAPSRVRFPRPDVADGYEINRDRANGFVAFWSDWRHSGARVHVRGEPNVGVTLALRRDLDRAELAALAGERRGNIGFLLQRLRPKKNWVSAIIEQVPPASGDRCKGHLELVRGVPGAGGVVVGWAIGLPPYENLLLSEDGTVLPLVDAVRWDRDDVTKAFSDQFGVHCFNSGFFTGWHDDIRPQGTLSLVASDGNRAELVATAKWELAPPDPVSFARFSFQLGIPPDLFSRRLEQHDGPVIERLLTQAKSTRRIRKEVHRVGSELENPACSLVVPLYARFDFMHHQLIEFGADPWIKANCEIIYVVDDPRLLAPIKGSMDHLYDSYGVPFTVVWGGQNLGFAGANNLGVSVARSATVLLLNSDVVPVQAGWLEKMWTTLTAGPETGIVGARLLFPNGAVQHDGMSFNFDRSWNAYLNKHPGAGLEPSPVSSEDAVAEALTVTAACLLIRKETYDAVGGLDDTFLIGDFEDSDLCLKVRREGLKVVIRRDLKVVHLERQSFSGIGQEAFRDRVARFNAHRHQARWGTVIEALGAAGGVVNL